jgi:hypothetical protein
MDDYEPSYPDYLRVRVRSTGIREETFYCSATGSALTEKPSLSRKKSRSSAPDDCVAFRFIDVGGQRSERRKWMRAFDVAACVYLVGVGDYNMRCFEDGSTRRLDDALSLFAELAALVVDRKSAAKFFDQKTLIIFLNKWDVLENKLGKEKYSFKEAFGKRWDDAVLDKPIDESRATEARYVYEVMLEKMQRILEIHAPKTVGEVHFHRTRAVSTRNAQKVMRAVQSGILRQSLAVAGLIV